MRKMIFFTSLMFAGLLAADAATIDLTPHPDKKELEGIQLDAVSFRCGDKIAMYQPPDGWRAAGSERRVTFKPEMAQAEASIEAFKKPEVATFDPETVKALKIGIEKSLPRGAEQLVWDADEENTVIWNRHPTYRVTLSYSQFGQRFTTTVLFCNFANEQLRFALTAHEGDFQKLYPAFRTSLFSFEGVD